MKLSIHYKMGHKICNNLTENGVPLKKSLFILGNLVPDILATYIFNKHSQQKCALRLKKLLKRIYLASSSNRLIYSYYSGVVAHYICDFLCYAHTSVFSGSLHDHLIYEKHQSFIDSDEFPFYIQDRTHYSLTELIFVLEERIIRRVWDLSRNAALSHSDIPVAINIASWATCAAYFHFDEYSQRRENISFYALERIETA